MKKSVQFGVAGACCLALAGCYRKVSEGGSLTLSLQPWVPLLVAIAGVVLVPVGVVLLTRRQLLWGIALPVVGLLMAIAIAPGMYLDRVVVNEEGFTSRHGFWWSPSVHDIRYKDLSVVRVVVEERTTRRGKSYSYSFDCSFKSGREERVPLGDVMREALPEIAQQFRAHGVPVEIPPNLPE